MLCQTAQTSNTTQNQDHANRLGAISRPHLRESGRGSTVQRSTGGQTNLRSVDASNQGINAGFVAGDPDAMRAVVAEHGRALYGVAYRILNNRVLAEEAVQHALLQAWRAADTFDPERQLAPWLVTITKRAAIDVHRRERRHIADALQDHDSVHIERGFDGAWEVYRVRQALSELPAAEREVLALTHFSGMTQEDAADRLGIPLGTVKSRSYRAYRKLSSLLADLEELTA